MKHLLLIALTCTILITANSQTISPRQSTEFCPNTEYTFTVTIPKPYQSMIGLNGCIVTQTPQSPVNSTFSFKGKFNDVNQKQTFRIYYTDNTSYDFEFKKIKSLFYSATSMAFPPCNVIKPNQPTLTFPRCQVTSSTISFQNIQWFTNFENPEICFGSVTDYEYLLPAGWSIGTNTSNGSNWIAGGNSVVVTSDMSTGDGLDIRIRASNKSCGIGLYANGPVSTVRISRPAPTFTITPSGNQAYICSGTKNFTLNGLPTGAVVTSWTSSDPLLATVPAGFTGTTVPVTKTGGEGSVIITANINHCNYSYSVPVKISLGVDLNAVYSVTSDYISTNNNQFQYFSNPPQAIGYAYQPANKNVLFVTYINTTLLTSSPSWSVTGTYNLFYPYSNSASLYMATPNSGSYSRNIANIRMVANSVCGTIDKTFTFQAVVSGYSYSLKASPNPVNGNINLSIEKVIEEDVNSTQQLYLSKESALASNKTVFHLYDIITKSLIKEWSYGEIESVNYKLNVFGVRSGWYILKMDRENKSAIIKVFIQ